jgi:hypothetical protein
MQHATKGFTSPYQIHVLTIFAKTHCIPCNFLANVPAAVLTANSFTWDVSKQTRVAAIRKTRRRGSEQGDVGREEGGAGDWRRGRARRSGAGLETERGRRPGVCWDGGVCREFVEAVFAKTRYTKGISGRREYIYFRKMGNFSITKTLMNNFMHVTTAK